MEKLKVDKSGRYLMWSDGRPFFYLADTAWELLYALSLEEIESYLKLRKSQGFNTVQIVFLTELSGINGKNVYGCRPFKDIGKEERLVPDISDGGFWQMADEVILKAEKMDMMIAAVPCWGCYWHRDRDKTQVLFENEKRAYNYGKWLGKRYRERTNILWILGGDRPVETKLQEKIIDAMACGIREEDDYHLMTFHPCGAKTGLDFIKNKTYIDFNSCQSGHGIESYESWNYIHKMYTAEKKPCIDIEPRYEEHPACFTEKTDYFWTAQDIRNNAYWNVLAGACGHTYGSNAVWCFRKYTNSYYKHTWKESLESPGAGQMKHVMDLRLSRPYFEFRPDNTLTAGRQYDNARQTAGRGENYAFIYTPLGLPIEADLSMFSGQAVKCSWYNPRNGAWISGAVFMPQKTLLIPPEYGKDWIAVLDNVFL